MLGLTRPPEPSHFNSFILCYDIATISLPGCAIPHTLIQWKKVSVSSFVPDSPLFFFFFFFSFKCPFFPFPPPSSLSLYSGPTGHSWRTHHHRHRDHHHRDRRLPEHTAEAAPCQHCCSFDCRQQATALAAAQHSTTTWSTFTQKQPFTRSPSL